MSSVNQVVIICDYLRLFIFATIICDYLRLFAIICDYLFFSRREIICEFQEGRWSAIFGLLSNDYFDFFPRPIITIICDYLRLFELFTIICIIFDYYDYLFCMRLFWLLRLFTIISDYCNYFLNIYKTCNYFDYSCHVRLFPIILFMFGFFSRLFRLFS